MESKEFASGIFALIIGLILYFQAPEYLGKNYFSLFFIVIGVALILNGLRK